MKQSKIIAIAFMIGNLVLIIFCAVFYLKADRKAPQFSFGASELTYAEGMDSSLLLTGITAVDDKDGDLTDRIVVEKVVWNPQRDAVVVYYAVSDQAGNVSKISRQFPAAGEAAGQNQEEMRMGMESGIWQELEAETPSSGEPEGMEEPLEEADPSPEPTEEPTPEPSAEPTEAPTPEPLAEPTEEPTPEPTPKPTVNPGIPVLTLKTSEVTTSVGVPPAWVNVIGTMTDDKDSYETLFHNLKVSKYDVNKAGTYQVSVSTEDSDGNPSRAVPLTIVVK